MGNFESPPVDPQNGQYKITQQLEELTAKNQLLIKSKEASDASLAEANAKLAAAKAAKLRVKSLIQNTKMHIKNEIVYITTTRHYAKHNLFKVGHTKNITSRLATYNTGCPADDNIYVAWKFDCYSAKTLENRIKFWLGDFLECKEKEMYNINFTYLKNIVEEIATHFDRETDTQNKYISEQLTLATEAEPVIPTHSYSTNQN